MRCLTEIQPAIKPAGRLASGELRCCSPVIFWEDESYTISTGLGPVALTNDPAMHSAADLAAKQDNDGRCDASTGRPRRLVAQQHTGVQGMNEIFQPLGIDPENPTIEAIEAALTDEKLAPVASLLGLGEEATKADVPAAIGAMLERGPGRCAAAGDDAGRGGGGESRRSGWAPGCRFAI